MNNLMKNLFGTVVILLGLTACSTHKEAVRMPLQPMKTLTAMGYGTAVDKQLMPAQRRLMGMRASKMEAYRDMAEQIYGVNLNGKTTVEQMVVKNDDYRTFIDTLVRGARVKSIRAIDVDTYETVLEYDLTPRFFECVNANSQLLNDCIRAAQGFSLTQNIQSSTQPILKTSEASCETADCQAYPSMKGFAPPKDRPNYAVGMMEALSKHVASTPKQVYANIVGSSKHPPL